MMLRLAAAAGALAAAGCSTAPFAYLDGNRYYRAEMNAYSVIVLDVDGVSSTRNPVMVTEFGPRRVRVQGPPPPGWTYGEAKTFTLDVKPCTRYYLKALKKNRLQLDFEPAVDHEERIAGCKVQ